MTIASHEQLHAVLPACRANHSPCSHIAIIMMNKHTHTHTQTTHKGKGEGGAGRRKKKKAEAVQA